MTRSMTGESALLVFILCGILAVAIHPLLAEPSPRLQVFFATGFTDQEYQKKAYGRVAGAWKMPAQMPPEGGKAVVIIIIARNGDVPELRLHLESGSKVWDDAAIAAVKSAVPLEPLPKGYDRDSVEAHFHFAYSE